MRMKNTDVNIVVGLFIEWIWVDDWSDCFYKTHWVNIIDYKWALKLNSSCKHQKQKISK